MIDLSVFLAFIFFILMLICIIFGGEERTMSVKKLLFKIRWKAYEALYSICWHVFGQLPITWDMKHRRNMAFAAYQLLKD